MSGPFSGIADAEVFERGKYMAGGFRGVVEIKRTILKKTRAVGLAFIVELRIVETNMPEQHAVGSKATWFQKMSDLSVALPAIKGWAAACAGFYPHEKDAIESEVEPELEGALDQATAAGNETDNAFTGILLRLETEQIKTKNDRDFTRYDWEPYEDEEDEPKDAVDELAS